jgi:DNA-binding response OmpR family regulator
MKSSKYRTECKSFVKAPKNKRPPNRFFGSENEESRPRQVEFRYRILVVDDEPDIRRLNSELLIEAGYEVDIAADGVMASELLARNPYDLIITDNQMPRMSGVELLQELYSARKFVPAIMATGTMPAEELKCQQWFQVATTLIKPYTLPELLGAVRNSLRSRLAASSTA